MDEDAFMYVCFIFVHACYEDTQIQLKAIWTHTHTHTHTHTRVCMYVCMYTYNLCICIIYIHIYNMYTHT